jgi:hypothetical protein
MLNPPNELLFKEFIIEFIVHDMKQQPMSLQSIVERFTGIIYADDDTYWKWKELYAEYLHKSKTNKAYEQLAEKCYEELLKL